MRPWCCARAKMPGKSAKPLVSIWSLNFNMRNSISKII
ncbi:Hypothetical protein SmN45_4138 [Serratia marcescens]|nr:Hypothetical protein SmN45_4138 [Serratia marcescens]